MTCATFPGDHPDARLLRPRARTVSRLVRGAGAVWVSTPVLAATLADLRDDVRVVENGLDERLWAAAPPPTPPRQGPVRILFMGTATHDADFAIVEGALARLKSVFAEHVSVDLLGISGRYDMPSWVEPHRHAGARQLGRIRASSTGSRSSTGTSASLRSPIPRSIAASRRSRRWTMRRSACRCWHRTARCIAARWPTAPAAG